jgi:hypothetical protein
VQLVAAASLPAEPDDPAWERAPEFVAALIPQDLVDPRLMQATTAALRVRALTDGKRAAFRLEWADASEDNGAGPNTFSDGCAVQLPAKAEPTLPAPQMGEPGRAVHITFWNAAWQEAAAGHRDSLPDLYPRATVDHYPFESAALKQGSPEQRAMADRYAPARRLGNFMHRPPGAPVQDLVAEGPGTLRSLPETTATGTGKRIADGWSVAIVRDLPEGFASAPEGQIAFAVWEGAQGEVGSRKMRTGWVTMTRVEQP